jgi:hypothetical protein
MSEYQLIEEVYVSPTPAGAYYAASSPHYEPARQLLFGLMSSDQTPKLNTARLCAWTYVQDEQDALEVLYRAQVVGWLQGEAEPRAAPRGSIEEDAPNLLQQISQEGKALLADGNGFYLARSGFPHEVAEELSVLSAETIALQTRYEGLIHNNLGLSASGWAVVNGSGGSQLGMWPLFIGSQRFALVIAGTPSFHRGAYSDLIWILSKRYLAQ